MKKIIILFIGILLSLWLSAQENLVLNPSFEDYEECPDEEGEFANTVSVWTTYFANPEYMNCDFQRLQDEFPRTGTGYAGAYLIFEIAPSNYYFREYLHGQLIEPLEKDSIYYAEFYARPSFLTGFVDRIEMAISEQALDTLLPTNGVLDVEPIIAYQDGILSETANYTKISGCFTAKGGEQYITLGNFNRTPDTQVIFPSTSLEVSSYIYFDDVAVYRFSFDHLLELDTTICAGTCIDIFNFLGDSFEWTLEGATPSFSTEMSPSNICYEEEGIFDISVIISHCGGTDTLVIQNAVNVIPFPNPLDETVQSYTISEGDQLTLNACAEGEEYRWFPSEGLSCNDCPNPMANPIVDMEYTLEISNGGICVSECRYIINVQPLPEAIFELSDETICSGECVSVEYLGDPSNLTFIQWEMIGSDIGSFQGLEPPLWCYEEAGSYELVLSVSNGVDTVISSQMIDVFSSPDLISVSNVSYQLLFGDTIQLEACALGLDYLWTSVSPLSCLDCPNPVLIATSNETIQLEVSDNGNCISICEYAIEVVVPDDIFIPNVFSPNDDGNNDLFMTFGPYHTLVHMKIFDRWGGLLYDGQSSDASWDGMKNGTSLSSGIYVYLIKYIDNRTGEEKQKSGEVLLIK